MAADDASPKFSLRRLFVVTTIYAVSVPMWGISWMHGIAALVAATGLSGVVLLAKRRENSQILLKLATSIAFGILAGLAGELALSGDGPTDDIIIHVYSATAFGALLGWVLASRIGGKRRGER